MIIYTYINLLIKNKMAIKLKDLKVFEGINLTAINMIIDNARRQEYKSGDIIINAWDKSDWNAYIIQEGQVWVIMNNKEISTLFEGDIFGEIALITNEPRTATIVAKTDLVTLKINKELLDMIIKNFENWKEIKKVIMERILENLKIKSTEM